MEEWWNYICPQLHPPGHQNFLGSPDTRILAKQNSKPTYRSFSVFESASQSSEATSDTIISEDLKKTGCMGTHWGPPDVMLATDWHTETLHHINTYLKKKRPALHLTLCRNLICNAHSQTLTTMHFLNKLHGQNQMKSMPKPPSTNSV